MDHIKEGEAPISTRTRTALRSQAGLEDTQIDGVGQLGQIQASIQEAQETLKAQNRRLSGEVERLKRTEERLEKDNARLRGNRRNLKDENAQLREMLAIAEGKVAALEAKGVIDDSEIKRLQERYREVTDQKVALAEQLAVSFPERYVIIVLSLLSQGPAKLPLEILLTIAGFVAGNNDYGTLLSFCLMSKRIREETQSTFTKPTWTLISITCLPNHEAGPVSV